MRVEAGVTLRKVTACADRHGRVAVIDVSGDGKVATEAGASFRMGREAKSEFGERSALEVADDITMGASVTALVRKSGEPVEFIAPLGTPPFGPGYGSGGGGQGQGLRAQFVGSQRRVLLPVGDGDWRADRYHR